MYWMTKHGHLTPQEWSRKTLSYTNKMNTAQREYEMVCSLNLKIFELHLTNSTTQAFTILKHKLLPKNFQTKHDLIWEIQCWNTFGQVLFWEGPSSEVQFSSFYSCVANVYYRKDWPAEITNHLKENVFPIKV
jgi:hypothetical protein